MRLTGPQYEQLVKALLSAFPTPDKLAQMLRFRIDKHLHAIALGDDLTDINFKLIRTAEAEGWTLQLITAARESSPGNPKLLAFAQQFGLAPEAPARPALERIIRETNLTNLSPLWLTRLATQCNAQN